MKKILREYIRKQINFLFEVDAASAAASAAQGTSIGMSSDAAADTIANYDDLKANQEELILTMQEKLKKEKLRQKVNLDKIKKLNNTFSQVQDSELALIPGGKSEDNKVKKMKQTSYLKDKKELEDGVKQTEDQMAQAERNIQDIENMKKQAETTSKTTATPSAPSTTFAP
jgi:vacuolar-type H+-ATPase subunit I/STV1